MTTLILLVFFVAMAPSITFGAPAPGEGYDDPPDDSGMSSSKQGNNCNSHSENVEAVAYNPLIYQIFNGPC